MQRQQGTFLLTVNRAIDVLDFVAEARVPPSVRDLAQQLDINISTTYHIVNTLLARRYLSRNDQGKLAIGERIGALNSALARLTKFDDEVRGIIRNLAAESAETVYLTGFQNGAVIIQVVEESQRSLRVTGLNVGYSGAEDRRASGKAVLAYLDHKDLVRVFERLNLANEDSASSLRRRELEEELDQIRQSGFAFDNEDYEPGVCCVAVPYFGAGGIVVGSVTASAPALRVNRLRSVVQHEVAKAAAQISNLLVS